MHTDKDSNPLPNNQQPLNNQLPSGNQPPSSNQPESPTSTFSCSHCSHSFQLATVAKKLPTNTNTKTNTPPPKESIRFCPLCGNSLEIITTLPPPYPPLPPLTPFTPLTSFTPLTPPPTSPIASSSLASKTSPLTSSPSPQFELLSNRYQLLENIGKGGMGEVFLTYDLTCGRRLALKRIRPDLLDHPQIRHRFLKEAHITCQLTHPAIIPIYSIQAAHLSAYYTMPFVEGETLKQIIRKTARQEKNGEPLDHIGGSIPALMRIFMTICQAIAYAHSKGVLHRDLKPENIIIGKYGEVMILDWGLAIYIHTSDQTSEEENKSLPSSVTDPHLPSITRIGKVVGTIAYMAPERALGQPATIQTDIYALGVILYQLLSLKTPFKRGSLKEFRKEMAKEEWIDPVLAAPYRDVPKMLARLTEKCLKKDPKERYESVDQLIYDLENYLGGRSEWFHVAQLNMNGKEDWEFQEHILMAQHLAITRSTEEAEWVNLMISRQSFTGNTRIETSVCLGKSGRGIGMLLSIPEMNERKTITDGYSLWLGSDEHRTTTLSRSNVEVMQAPDIFLKRLQWIKIRLEKIDETIYLYLDDVLQFSYIAHLPLIGTHIGLLSRDSDFEMSSLNVYVGSLNLTINCLAVPDAFLAHRDFNQALSEYHRIAYSFPDRAEGREALFRAGLTFIEQAKGKSEKLPLLDQALHEFEKLHGTPSAPLEYLGKALVYQILNENEEEIKCFDIAYRRYPKHPLLPVLQEQILSRMHEVSRKHRIATYRFILLSVRHLSSSTIDTHTRRLFSSVKKHWEPLPFIEEHPFKSSSPYYTTRLAIILAFWLAKPHALEETIEELLKSSPLPTVEIANALSCLIELGAWEIAKSKLEQIYSLFPSTDDKHWKEIEMMIACHEKPLEIVFKELFSSPYFTLDFPKMRTLIYALDQAIEQKKTTLVHNAMEAIEHCELTFDARLRFNQQRIWALLIDKNWKPARELFYAYPVEFLNNESSLLHFLYGCWLAGAEGEEMAIVHFTGVFEVAHPRSWTLASHDLVNNLINQGWLENAFLWEKRAMYRQLSLYYHCIDNDSLSQEYFYLSQQQFVSSQ